MAINSSSIVSSLGAGSGIDIKSLAESLIEAERKPFKDRIDQKVEKSEAKISGYGAILSYLRPLRASMEKLANPESFGSLAASSSQPAALTAVAQSGASVGSHSVSVLGLASAQVSRSAGFDSTAQSIGDGPFKLQLNQGSGQPRLIDVSSATPQAIVDAVNQDATANSTGISAQLVRINTKGISQYVIELQGQQGIDQAFTLAIDPSTYLSSETPPAQPPVLQKNFLAEAANARLMVDGQLITRPTNSITGAISNVTLELNSVTSSPAKLNLTRDVQAAKDNINSLVSTYNDFVEALKELGNSKSEVETLGGSLVGDGLLQTVRNQIRSALQLSDRDNASVNAISSLGISVGLDGRMTIKSDRVLTQKLTENFDQVVRLFTSSPASTSKKGLAGDTLAAIDVLMPKYGKGRIQNQIDASTKEVTRYKDQLTQLEARLAKSLERYMSQFSIMQSMVGDSNNVRAGLKNSLGFNSNQ